MPNARRDKDKDKPGPKRTPAPPESGNREGSTTVPKDPPPWWPPCLPWPPGSAPPSGGAGTTGFSPDFYRLLFGACVAALVARGVPVGEAIAICLRTFVPGPGGAGMPGGTLLPSEPPPGWPPGWPWPPSLPIPVPGGTSTPGTPPPTRPIGWESGVEKASANLKNCTPFRFELPPDTSVRIEITEAGADTLTDNPGETDISLNGRPLGPIIGDGFLDVSGPGTLVVHLKGPEDYARVKIIAQ